MIPAFNTKWVTGIIIVQLAMGMWLFTALCAHASKSAIINTDYGIGGRLGFSYFLYNILWFLYWAYLLSISMSNKYDIEIWTMMKYVTGFFAIGNWFLTFIIIGAARQISFTVADPFRSDSFLAAAKASIAALIISMLICLIFIYFVITKKRDFLDSYQDNEPQEPTNLPTTTIGGNDNQQQAFYQGHSAGYQADSSQSYGEAPAF